MGKKHPHISIGNRSKACIDGTQQLPSAFLLSNILQLTTFELNETCIKQNGIYKQVSIFCHCLSYLRTTNYIVQTQTIKRVMGIELLSQIRHKQHAKIYNADDWFYRCTKNILWLSIRPHSRTWTFIRTPTILFHIDHHIGIAIIRLYMCTRAWRFFIFAISTKKVRAKKKTKVINMEKTNIFGSCGRRAMKTNFACNYRKNQTFITNIEQIRNAGKIYGMVLAQNVPNLFFPLINMDWVSYIDSRWSKNWVRISNLKW